MFLCDARLQDTLRVNLPTPPSLTSMGSPISALATWFSDGPMAP